MRRTTLIVLMVVAAGLLAGLGTASAHECAPGEPEPCHPTPVYPNWRPPYVPLFGVNDTHCETTDQGEVTEEECKENRHEAQRWRDEWGCDTQWCIWAKIQFSVDDDRKPQSVHAGTAADHSMTEGFHSSEGHGTAEGNHDSHGGSIYADVCLASDAGTSYDGQAGACERPEDTQVGINIMDHNPCGVFIPIVACTDEYHVIRPLDLPYTMEQMEESGQQAGRLVTPEGRDDYVCGYQDPGSDYPVPCRALVP